MKLHFCVTGKMMLVNGQSQQSIVQEKILPWKRTLCSDFLTRDHIQSNILIKDHLSYTTSDRESCNAGHDSFLPKGLSCVRNSRSLCSHALGLAGDTATCVPQKCHYQPPLSTQFCISHCTDFVENVYFIVCTVLLYRKGGGASTA